MVLIGLKVSHDDLTAKHCYSISGAQDLLMLMASKFLIQMTRPQNIKIKEQCLRPGHLY